MESLEDDSDKDSPPSSPTEGVNEQTDEEKKYILEKIQQANKELQDQEAPDDTRRRRLHFKETLVDLVVPPLKFGDAEGGKENTHKQTDADTAEEMVSGKLLELKLSPHDGNEGPGLSDKLRCDGEQEVKEGRVLVEKDGKFDLVSLEELESQGLLPPIPNNEIDSGKIRSSSSSTSSLRSRAGSSCVKQGVDNLRAPRPPAQPRIRPSSASHSQRGIQRKDNRRRVQSATETPYHSTYMLSPQQKELLQRIQERKDRLAREVG